MQSPPSQCRSKNQQLSCFEEDVFKRSLGIVKENYWRCFRDGGFSPIL